MEENILKISFNRIYILCTNKTRFFAIERHINFRPKIAEEKGKTSKVLVHSCFYDDKILKEQTNICRNEVENKHKSYKASDILTLWNKITIKDALLHHKLTTSHKHIPSMTFGL